MTYTEHPSCIQPDKNATIWRYIDFTKLVSLLERRELFFSTIGILKQSDKHEGTYNQATIEASKEKPLSIQNIGSPLLRNFGKFVAVNCWQISQIESVAMWDLYLKGGEGVAIKSTFQRLADSFAVTPKPQVMIGKVHYLAETEVIPEPSGFNAIDAYLWKWNSYQHEQELRALVLALPEELYPYNGIYVPIDLDLLIEQTIVSPKAPRWFAEMVVAIASKYGLQERIAPSILSGKPGSLDADKKLSVAVPCPLCKFEQEIFIEPFQIQDYPDNSTIVFSADRVSFQCQNCRRTLILTGLKWTISDAQEESPESS